MSHPLVTQLRFTRSEFRRALEGVSEEDGIRRLGQMNSISWIVGHMAWHEQFYWLWRAQGTAVAPGLYERCGSGQPASTPPLAEMWAAWHAVMQASDAYLDAVTTDTLTTFMIVDGQPHCESIGSMLRRVTYHYWYHIGEGVAIRQMLGHTQLPEFVGAIHDQAPYVPEPV